MVSGFTSCKETFLRGLATPGTGGNEITVCVLKKQQKMLNLPIGVVATNDPSPILVSSLNDIKNIVKEFLATTTFAETHELNINQFERAKRGCD